jgi:hypothetical protein
MIGIIHPIVDTYCFVFFSVIGYVHVYFCSHPKVARFDICEAKARTANLVVTLDIVQVWLGYAFYGTRGSSWKFWIWFNKEGKEVFVEALIWYQITSSSVPRWSFCQEDQDGHVDQIIKWLIWLIWEGQLTWFNYWSYSRFSSPDRCDLSHTPVRPIKPKSSKCHLDFTIA